jgi:SAM-dependent methyltransferase
MGFKAISDEIKLWFRLSRNVRRNPNIGADVQKSRLFNFATRIIPSKVLRHYIYSSMVGKEASPYNAKKYFDSYHTSTRDGRITDGTTISPTFSPITSRYHYCVTEKAVIESLLNQPNVPTGGSLLDVGSGAGHWIDFYLEVLQPSHVTGMDISTPAIETLEKKYRSDPRVHIIEDDLAKPDFDLGMRFHLINAIGVMFHIVDDSLWLRAVKNLGRHLAHEGLIVIGGQFGWVTRNVQFHASDEFGAWDEVVQTKSKLTLVNKRIRSLRFWKKTAREAGLTVLSVRRTQEVGAVHTPENNIMLLGQLDR